MPPRLPIELQILILYHLGSEHRYPGVTDTLARCCLVCRAWFPFCREFFWMYIQLLSGKQMAGVISAMSSTTNFLGSYTKELHVLSMTNSRYVRPFHHLVPYYLAQKLPHLENLTFLGTTMNGNMQAFPVSTQLTMHLSQFEHVTSLYLGRFHFHSFWDLRRFVVALPVISHLKLARVTWPQFFEDLQRVPSLPFIANKLQEINCADITVLHEVLWFRVTSRRVSSLEGQRMGGHLAEDRGCPAFTTRDAAAIGKFISQISRSRDQRVKLEYLKQDQCCDCSSIITLDNLGLICSLFRQIVHQAPLRDIHLFRTRTFTWLTQYRVRERNISPLIGKFKSVAFVLARYTSPNGIP